MKPRDPFLDLTWFASSVEDSVVQVKLVLIIEMNVIIMDEHSPLNTPQQEGKSVEEQEEPANTFRRPCHLPTYFYSLLANISAAKHIKGNILFVNSHDSRVFYVSSSSNLVVA